MKTRNFNTQEATLKCITSALRFVLPVAPLLGTTAIFTSVAPTAARAEYDPVGSWTSSDGTTFTVYHDANNGEWAVAVEKGDTLTVSYSVDGR
jgi:hypothetical protein